MASFATPSARGGADRSMKPDRLRLVDGIDTKDPSRAAYERLDSELRSERRRLVGAAFVAVAIFSSFVLLLWWARFEPVGAPRVIQGTAVRTVQVFDDTEHIVDLVVDLDEGQTVRVRPDVVIPIGARVWVNQRRNRFGRSTYDFAGLLQAGADRGEANGHQGRPSAVGLSSSTPP